MNVKKWAAIPVIIALFAGLFAHQVAADLYWETESVLSDIPNQYEMTSIQKYYFTHNASRVELGGRNAFILNYDAMELYVLDTVKKTFREIDLGKASEIANPSAGGTQMVKILVALLTGIRITPANEVKTIAGYKCRRCDVQIGFVRGEYWVSEDVKGYKELRTQGAIMGEVADRNPLLKQIDVAGIFEKLSGFPVYTVNRVMGATVISTLRKVEQKTLDRSLFVIPEGYKMKKSMLARAHAPRHPKIPNVSN